MSFGGVFDLDGMRARQGELEAATADPNLWNDRERAERVSREKNHLEREIALYDELEVSLDDAEALLELANEEDDEASRSEVVQSDAPRSTIDWGTQSSARCWVENMISPM